MTLYASPILTSLLDTDAYKLHMQQAVFHRYPAITVAAEFRCRGDELLGEYADEIRAQLKETRRSRLPVQDGESDSIIGVVLMKDLIDFLAAGEVDEDGLTRWIRDNWPKDAPV